MTIARTALRRTLAVAATAALAVGSLAACSAGGGACRRRQRRPTSTPRSRRAASSPTGAGPRRAEAQVAAFEEAYPNVDVELVNAGTDNEQYTKLQNAIKAGSGCARRRADRVLRASRSSRSPTRSSTSAQYGFGELEDQYTRLDLGRRERRRQASSACRRTPARWRCSTTRRSSTSTASPCRPRGTSTSPPRRSCTPPTRRRTSPTTPATPASPPA